MSRRVPSNAATPETRRVAIYTRKTMGLEQEFNSLDSQRESCLAYIQRQPGWTLIDERYDDGGFTGANIDRPAFTRLMADVEARKIDVIVVYKVDRLSRSLLDFVKVMERLSAAGASFVSITQNFSTADAMGRLTMNMLMSFAEFEREMISERTRDKIAGARRKGKWTGGPVPFGYSVKDKKLLVNELEAHVVREAFRLFLQERQMAAVARLLNEQGLLPRGMPSRPAKRGLLWTKESIAHVLRSPLYAGFMMHGHDLFPGEHPALINDATYQQAQRLLHDAKRELRVRATNPDYLLRGLLRCGCCQHPMTTASTQRGKKTYRFYRCSTREKFGKAHCAAMPLPAHAIEDFVVQRITTATADGVLAESVRQTLMARIDAERAKLALLQKTLPDRVADASAAASNLADGVARLDGRARARRGQAARRSRSARRRRAAAHRHRGRGRRSRARRERGRVDRQRAPRLRQGLEQHDLGEPGAAPARARRQRARRRGERRLRGRAGELRRRGELEGGCVMESEHPPQASTSPPSDRHVLSGPLFRRRSSSVTLAETPPPPKPEPVRRPAKVAQQLALAHHLDAAIRRGEIADRAALARALGFTRARITQLMELLLLAPDVQETVLRMEAIDGAEPLSERALRAVAIAGAWAEQRAAWASLRDRGTSKA